MIRERAAPWDPRRIFRRAAFRLRNRAADPQEIVLRRGLGLRIDPRSREPFEHFCFRSLAMARELDAFAREMPARRRLLDVGACHGIFALAFAHGRSAARVLAVEPSAIAFPILLENIRLNRLANVTARQVACGAAAGHVRMRQVWHHLVALPSDAPAASPAGTGTGKPASAPPSGADAPASSYAPAGPATDGAIEVPMVSVDELCAELDFLPDLIKIDVEGYELAVLAGARVTLARHRPTLFLELHPRGLSALGGSAEAVTGLLETLGYRFLSSTGAPLGSRQIQARESVSRLVCSAHS